MWGKKYLSILNEPAYALRAEIYDCFFGDRTVEINGWFHLAGLAGPRVVEWMCGTGVLAHALAQRGLGVIGVDNVKEMLDVARKIQQEHATCEVTWVLGDIRDAVLPVTDNDFAFVAAGSFGHLILKSDQIKALKNMHHHLRPGGTLAFNLSLAGDGSFPWKTRGPFPGLKPSIKGAGVRKVFVRNKYDAQQRLYTIHDKVAIDKDGQIRELEYQFVMRHFTPEEISGLLLESEFDDIKMYGDWDLNPWIKGSPQWIVCSTKQ